MGCTCSGMYSSEHFQRYHSRLRVRNHRVMQRYYKHVSDTTKMAFGSARLLENMLRDGAHGDQVHNMMSCTRNTIMDSAILCNTTYLLEHCIPCDPRDDYTKYINARFSQVQQRLLLDHAPSNRLPMPDVEAYLDTLTEACHLCSQLRHPYRISFSSTNGAHGIDVLAPCHEITRTLRDRDDVVVKGSSQLMVVLDELQFPPTETMVVVPVCGKTRLDVVLALRRVLLDHYDVLAMMGCQAMMPMRLWLHSLRYNAMRYHYTLELGDIPRNGTLS